MTGRVGLYDPAYEHDACGVAFVARLERRRRRTRRSSARSPRSRTSSTAARPGADALTGDGAGILIQLPDAFFRGGRRRGAAAARAATASRSASCRTTTARAGRARAAARRHRRRGGPARRRAGATCRSTRRTSARRRGAVAPLIRQLFVAAGAELAGDQDAFERKLYVIRRVAELAAGPDLVDPELLVADDRLQGDADGAAARAATTPTCATSGIESALALVHSRFSTNTFPSWELAHPYRMIAHNGEINTLRGNVNWMRARESQLASELFGDDLAEGAAGRPPGRLGLGDLRQRARAARARRPLAAARDDDDDPRGLRRAATTCPTSCAASTPSTSCLMEPWDGPAAIAFTDGTRDRRDARPQRPAPRPLARDEGRLGRARLRDRRARRAARERPPQGAAAARQALPRRPRARAGSSTTRRSSARSRAASPTASGSSEEVVHLADLPERAAARAAAPSRCARASSRSATRRRT